MKEKKNYGTRVVHRKTNQRFQYLSQAAPYHVMSKNTNSMGQVTSRVSSAASNITTLSWQQNHLLQLVLSSGISLFRLIFFSFHSFLICLFVFWMYPLLKRINGRRQLWPKYESPMMIVTSSVEYSEFDIRGLNDICFLLTCTLTMSQYW